MKENVCMPTVPYEEYKGRIDRARQCLAAHEMDAMILFAPQNIYYYGGLKDLVVTYENYRNCLIVSHDHDPVFVSPVPVVSQVALHSWVEEVRGWYDWKHPMGTANRSGKFFYDVLFDTLKDLGLTNKTIGLETGPHILSYLPIDEYEVIKGRLPKIVSADAAIWAQRMIKTAFEQEIIREGCRRSCLCIRAAIETVRPGVNELDVHRAFWQKALDLDMIHSDGPIRAIWCCMTTSPGERQSKYPVDRIIKVGDFGMCDASPPYKQYHFDFQRFFYVGKPPEKLLYIQQLAYDAWLETFEALRPGVVLKDLFRLSEQALEKRGYPHGHFPNYVGHMQGLSFMEPPIFTADNEVELAPGMVFCIEVGAFDMESGYFGMPEDVLLVTDTGIENLTGDYLPHDLHVVPA